MTPPPGSTPTLSVASLRSSTASTRTPSGWPVQAPPRRTTRTPDSHPGTPYSPNQDTQPTPADSDDVRHHELFSDHFVLQSRWIRRSRSSVLARTPSHGQGFVCGIVSYAAHLRRLLSSTQRVSGSSSPSTPRPLVPTLRAAWFCRCPRSSGGDQLLGCRRQHLVHQGRRAPLFVNCF